MADVICIQCTAPECEADTVTGVLALYAANGWEEAALPTGDTRFIVHFDRIEEADALCSQLSAWAPESAIERKVVENQDWLASWRQFFTPVQCGRFTVLPPWRQNELPAGSLPIVIEPKCAFGTGHHETTALCLNAISDLVDSGRLRSGMTFFDLGTGTGILGIGCALCGLHGAGSDIDPLAVDNARENIDINKVKGFDVRLGSAEAAQGETFDFVIANILAGPLRELAPEIKKLLKTGGLLVLSGLLTLQAESVAEAYAWLGRPRHAVDGEWSALIFGE